MRWLGLFAKYWQPGQVKTRLAASIGEQAAAEWHRVFLAALLRRMADQADVRALAITPAEKSDEFRALAEPAWRIIPQTEGDLGDRLQAFFDGAFAAGASRVAVIGADSPQLTPATIEESFRRLDRHRVVLGPAEDGGYYLAGARDRTPPIFAGIPWGSADVWQATTAALETAGIDYAILPKTYDVDDLEGLNRLLKEQPEHRDSFLLTER